MESIRLSVAVNDAQGNFVGACRRLEMTTPHGALLLKVECFDIDHRDGLPFALLYSILRLGDHELTYREYQPHASGMCWDCVTITPKTAAALANYLRQHETPIALCGAPAIYAKWGQFGVFTSTDFKRYLL